MAKALIREVIKGQLQSRFKGITLKKNAFVMKYLERCAVLNTHTLDYTRPGCSFGTPVDPACSCAVFTYERRLSDTAPTVNNSFVRRQTKDKRAKHIMNSLNASRDGFEQSLSEEIPHATHTLAPSPPHTAASPQ